MNSHSRWLILPAVVVVSSLACSLISPATSTPPAAATLAELYTAAALTVQAVAPQALSATPPSTATSPFPTFSWVTASPRPAQAAPCDAAAFIADISIADGAELDHDTDFTKTWRIENVGTCTWTPAYALVFVGGDRLDASGSIGLPRYVYTGQFVDLSARMTAPGQNGHYQGFWKLRNPAGRYFGIGDLAQGAFWVDINVRGPTYTAYDFAANYCDADWQNNSKDLDCPGSPGDAKGFVLRLNHPVLETGAIKDEAGLLTVPKSAYNGLITGQYPAFKVRKGDRFLAVVNCQYKSYGCNVIFRLDYQIGDGDARTLGLWHEVYEGEYTSADLDLSSLAGQNVKFILKVLANGPPNQDNGLWFAPRIARLGSAPAATKTPTATPKPTFTSTPTVSPTATATP